MGNLKIGFVLDDTLDTADGVQQYIRTLGTWLTAQGHEVHYLVGYTVRKDIPNVHSLSKNVRVSFNGNRMSTPLPASKQKIRKFLHKEKFDVLHVQIPYSPFLAHRIILNAPSTTAIIGTFHIAPNSGLVSTANALLGRLLGGSLKKFDSIVSVSSAAAEFAAQKYGISSTVLPNVVTASHFVSAKPLDTSGQVQRIVFLGRLVPRKGCQTLLEAAHILRQDAKTVPFQVTVCGKGPLGQELKSVAERLNIQDIVEFAGYVDDDQKARYLKSADIAVFPSTGGESFGIVLIEAMAAEHPVVLGANNDGYKTVLAPCPDLLFPVMDPQSLANKIQVFLTDTDEKKHVLEWQKSYVRQFDVSVVGPRLLARYRQALRSR